MVARRPASKSSSPSKNISVCSNCRCQFVCGPKLNRESCPCPDCGHYRVHGLATARWRQHFTLCMATFGLLLIPVLVALETVSIATASAFGGLLGLGVLVGHRVIALRNPNGNISANLKHAAELIASEQMKRLVAGEPPAEPFPEAMTLLHRQVFILLVMAVAVVGISSAKALRRVNGWVANDSVFPGVVGPGDDFRVYFRESQLKGRSFEERDTKIDGLRSLGSLWGGNAKARLKVNTFGYTTNGLVASTQGEPTIEGRKVPSRERTFSPWVRVELEEDTNLAWRQCDLRLNLDISFPVRSKDQDKGSSDINYQMGHASARHDVSIITSAPHAGSIYFGAWLIGGNGGIVLLVICGYAMARSSSLRVPASAV